MFINKRIIFNLMLPRHRKTEPTLLWWTRLVVLIILSSGLIAYIYILINLIKNDEPSIQYSTGKVSQPFPEINITLRKPNATIMCYFQLAAEHGIPVKDCSANIESFASEINETIYKFTPLEDMNGINCVHLSWYHIISIDISNIVFRGELDDIKNNYPDRDLQKYIDYLQNYYIFPQENLGNQYYIKWTRRKYLVRDWTNYLGFPNYHISLRIAEPIASAPFETPGNWTDLYIYPYGIDSYGFADEYFESIETEKRNQTVLSNIGSLGGAIGILLGIYAILFGRPLPSPWGVFQNCCLYKPRSKEKLLKNLPMVPLIEKNQIKIEDQNVKEELTSLITKFHSLETILREYVINSDFLDELETGKNEISND